MIEVLCQAGADVNYQRTEGITPLFVNLEKPDTLRMLLRFGADPSIRLRSSASISYQRQEPEKLILLEEEALFKAERNVNGWEVQYRESARLLRDARLLRPRLRRIFSLRALCQRGRAGPTSVTPAMFAWLVGAAPPRPARLVCEYWLGEPPRRRRSE